MTTLTQSQHREYRALRRDGVAARRALQTIRLRETYASALEPFGEWQWSAAAYGAFVCADREVAGLVVRVLVGDDDLPVEWGDCEPSDEEREAAQPYYVAVQVLDEGEEVYHDGIGGVDAIDLPYMVTRDWEDAAGYALAEYLLDGALRFARSERAERAYWESRDVVTREVV